MDKKTDIIVTYIRDDYGVDYLDRYISAASVHNYVFEGEGERFVWESEQPCDLEEGHIYSAYGLFVGKRLFGGRGVCISEVEIVGEMRIRA
ncbi:hypothetical protein G5B47_02670 [Paenibacillus sp. 7124]|uniref:Uncharacterized protein n=1 Tax=Paenibacillus apii TaxID=1850370 RepID=A0A6M1PFN6_9BACL|nr:hypothetical protein [Paenibacillus apii]NGM81312.1 hypothetical protein [Paenibacillus apii]